MGAAFALPQRILCEQLDDFVLVEDEAIRQAMVWMIEHVHTLAEGAGAAPLAAAYQFCASLSGVKTIVICSSSSPLARWSICARRWTPPNGLNEAGG